MEDLEKLLAEENETPAPALEEIQEPKTDPEVEKKEQIKANLDKAIVEAQNELKRIRKEKQTVAEEDVLPKIDMDDPSAKAWDKHIQSQVTPVRTEIEQEKTEIRNSAITEFLRTKPALASNPEKLKEVITEYEALSKGRISEKTKEGVTTYLEKAYASVYHHQLLEAARNRRVEQAQGDAIFSDIAVSKGATNYSSKPEPTTERLSQDDRQILARWGMSPQEWIDMKKNT